MITDPEDLRVYSSDKDFFPAFKDLIELAIFFLKDFASDEAAN